jgi:hypothetical protein
VQSRIVVLALDNAGTVELAVVNISGGNDLTETGLISTTALSVPGAADSATVIYSTLARTSVAYRVVGYVESTQATAGTWATTPSTIQGCGGQALTSMSSLGYGQIWQVLTGSRAYSTTYYNTTGKPILVSVQGNTGSVETTTFVVDGVTVCDYLSNTPGGDNPSMQIIVPSGSSYSATGVSLRTWSELR